LWKVFLQRVDGLVGCSSKLTIADRRRFLLRDPAETHRGFRVNSSGIALTPIPEQTSRDLQSETRTPCGLTLLRLIGERPIDDPLLVWIDLLDHDCPR
jgi:hypothetical protein